MRAAPLFVIIAVLVWIAPAQAAQTPCPRAAGVRCETVTVPLDRTGAVPGTVRLRVARIAARVRRRAPLVALVGGPGQAGVVFAQQLRGELGAGDRDLVVFDQRGTGASGLLRCRSFERRLAQRENAGAGDCGRSLGPRRSFYTSADSAEDLEAIRLRLGAARIALYAVSYGTRVALEYLRRHPDRVERLLLDSPIADGTPDPFSLETLRAVPRVLRRACAAGCGGAARHPVGDLRRLTERLRRAPIRRVLIRDGRRKPVRLGVGDVYSLLVAGDVEPGLLRAVPPAVAAALRGRPGDLLRLKLRARRLESTGPIRWFSPAVFAATLCEESPVAWDRAADPVLRREQALQALAGVPEASVGPFDRTAALDGGLLPLCGDWPAQERFVEPAPAFAGRVPALILSGELDLRTPLESARRVVAALPGSRLVIERGVGHSVLGSGGRCASPATRAFFARRAVPRCGRG